MSLTLLVTNSDGLAARPTTLITSPTRTGLVQRVLNVYAEAVLHRRNPLLPNKPHRLPVPNRNGRSLLLNRLRPSDHDQNQLQEEKTLLASTV